MLSIIAHSLPVYLVNTSGVVKYINSIFGRAKNKQTKKLNYSYCSIS